MVMLIIKFIMLKKVVLSKFSYDST